VEFLLLSFRRWPRGTSRPKQLLVRETKLTIPVEELQRLMDKCCREFGNPDLVLPDPRPYFPGGNLHPLNKGKKKKSSR